jgi:PPOX class probable F420-dependent enzyme
MDGEPERPALLNSRARAFIETQRIARLATVDESGAPHVVPVCFAASDRVLYTPVDEKRKRADPRALRRLRNIAREPRVQLLFDAYDDADWSRLRFVQVRGTARVLDGGDEHARAVTLLRARYAQYERMALDERPVIAVDVARVVQWDAR